MRSSESVMQSLFMSFGETQGMSSLFQNDAFALEGVLPPDNPPISLMLKVLQPCGKSLTLHPSNICIQTKHLRQQLLLLAGLIPCTQGLHQRIQLT